ncbi:MAG: Rpn family recombination-promoting nuclease/putative transposase, partial [Spirochaetes bacterium]|nr:Rpn family recombination-promoting nuclease/putative transposase [Spirochaetota bacterium]
MSKKLKHNRKYKSGVFSILFGNEAALRELHYAIMTKKLPADTPVEINTILSLLFIGMGNDVSFAADGRLIVLIEHQSTVNESMPVRCLFYCVEIYAGIVKNKALY